MDFIVAANIEGPGHALEQSHEGFLCSTATIIHRPDS